MKYPDTLYVRDDVVFISYPKSGRTWLRVMLAKYLELLGCDISSEYFRCEHWPVKVARKNGIDSKRIIYLWRDPRDVIVSEYFENKNENRKHPFKGTLSEWIRGEKGIKEIAKFQGKWNAYLDSGRQGYLMTNYEVLVRFAPNTLKDVVKFLDLQFDEKFILEAVEYSSFDNMQKMEKGESLISKYRGRYGKSTYSENPDYRRVRRGKIGGWVDYFSDDDKKYVEEVLNPALYRP